LVSDLSQGQTSCTKSLGTRYGSGNCLDVALKPEVKDELVRAIFTDAQTRLRKPTNLKALTTDIDKLDWFSAREEGLGNLYEGLLEKNASDKVVCEVW
jgi:hypothetical protein